VVAIFGSVFLLCPLFTLTFLHLRYLLSYFIDYLRTKSVDSTPAFQSGIYAFTLVYSSLIDHSWS